MNKKNLFLILLSLTFPLSVSAISIEGMVHAAEQTALFVASGIVVILWIVTGVWFLTAQGQPDKLSGAKKSLIAAIVGTLIIIIAGSAMSLVAQAFRI